MNHVKRNVIYQGISHTLDTRWVRLYLVKVEPPVGGGAVSTRVLCKTKQSL